MSHPHSTHLDAFIGAERDRYPGRNNNRFAFALRQAARYEGFIRIILDRSRAAGADWQRHQSAVMKLMEGKNGGRTMTKAEVAAFAESGRLSTLLHLEVESFYLFAKIFLDHVARFIEHYFGQVRGLSLDSHDDLTRRFERYAETLGLAVPPEFSGEFADLRKRIADFRDYEIAHAKNPRTIYMTMWRPEGEPTIGKIRLYPTERDQQGQRESESVSELMQRIERHIDRVIALVVENREKSRYIREEIAGLNRS